MAKKIARVTEADCNERRGACNALNAEKRGRIADEIKALRREIRTGYALISLFIAILGILIKTGVV